MRSEALSVRALVAAYAVFCAVHADAGETRVAQVGERSREEVVAFFADNEFGQRPAAAEKPELLRFDKASDDRLMPGGKMVRKQVNIVYGGPFGTNSFPVTAFVPADAKGPVGAFLLICNRSYTENCDPERAKKSAFFPVEEIVSRGFAAVSFYTWDVAPDRDTGNTQGVFAAFERPGSYRDMKAWGTLSAWAWGASRVLDWLGTVPEIDAAKVAVVGHSRGGKTSLWAGVTDPRFAMVCVNGSGCAGAKLNHLDLPRSEHIAQIVGRFQFWFCLAYTSWVNREREMPFDQHELLACVAPRLLAVGSGSEDAWAGPEGERKATALARAAWADKTRVSYHCHDGKHDLGLDDWNIYLSHAERHWKAGRFAEAAEPILGRDDDACRTNCPAGALFVFDEAASDEFDGELLDAAKWDDWVESFQGRRRGFLFSRDNVTLGGGRLKLAARPLREDEKTLDNLARGYDTYATAIVKAKKKTFYGYYECRAKAMKAAVCNAFWLYDPLSDRPEAKYRPGDFSEEIDIFEVFGKEGSKPCDAARTLYCTVHRIATPYLEGRVFGAVEELPEKSGRPKVDFDFFDGYHTYGFLWTEKELKWFVDDVEVFARPNDRFHRPLHVTFDCEIMYDWVGEPDENDLPQTFAVDYFRHWRAVDEAAAR
ncbi:MAG: family 16 glycosylhydrolase [Kiritimatiellae bacterium]|nr:family 16 glycosylhydrolase [Kiritimatiellia bacterium]